jgi:starch synthase
VDCSLEDLEEGKANGFVFKQFTSHALGRAIGRAFALYGRKSDWTQVRARGMRQSLGWEAAAAKYVDLYHHLCRE